MTRTPAEPSSTIPSRECLVERHSPTEVTCNELPVWHTRLAHLFALLLATAPAARLDAQRPVTLGGYVEHQINATHMKAGWMLIDYDRVRLDIEARAGLDTRASAAVVYQLFRGNTVIALRDMLPEEFGDLADTASVTLEDRHYLNHAYVTLRPGPFEITAGKQYLTWGAAWVFNPTELFRPKNALEPTYEREGIGAICAKLSVGALSDVSLALVPEGGFETSGKLLRARHHIAGFDLSALLAEVHEAQSAAALLGSPDALDRRYVLGGDVTGELLGLGVWTEATWSEIGGERWVEATIGGNYTLAGGTGLLIEAHYNGRGRWDAPYPAALWLGRLAGGLRTLGKGTVFANVARPFGQLWTLGFSALTNAGDRSGVLVPSVTYSFAENVDLLFNGLVYFGADGTEFGQDSFGGFLRGRVHF